MSENKTEAKTASRPPAEIPQPTLVVQGGPMSNPGYVAHADPGAPRQPAEMPQPTFVVQGGPMTNPGYVAHADPGAPMMSSGYNVSYQANPQMVYMSRPPLTMQPVYQPVYNPQVATGQRSPYQDYLWLSIITTIFCILPFGIIGLIFSLIARSNSSQGDFLSAKFNSQRALGFNMAAIFTLVIGLTWWMMIYFY